MTTSVEPKAPYHHGDLATALAAEALRMVRKEGATALSLRRVAHSVGVSPSAAYAHYQDKDALLSAVAELGTRVFDQALVSAADGVSGESDEAALGRFMKVGAAYVEFAAAEPHLFAHIFGPYCPYQGSEQFVSLTAHNYKSESVGYQLMIAGLGDLEARGLLRSGTPEGLPVVLWTSMHGYASLVSEGCLPQSQLPELLIALGRLFLNEKAQLMGEEALGKIDT
jgi:AcrR family transcriptional regulator